MSRKSFSVFIVLALATATALANVYFKGKAVQGGTTANCPVDVMRIMWGADEMKTGDRIQGQIQVSKIVDEVNSIRIILQGIDATGAIVESYALSLTREYGYSSGRSRYPFKGVVFLKYDRGYIDRDLENAWFYFDFPKNDEIKNFLVVNMVLNDREVPCNLRLVGNRLPRSLTTMPRIKIGQQGDFSVTTQWVPPPPPTAESELVKKPITDKADKADKAVEQDRTVALTENSDDISGETTYTTPGNWGLSANGGTFSLIPSVIKPTGNPSRMELLLSGSTSVSIGYSFRLAKILLFDPGTKKRLTIDSGNVDDWPSFYLSTKKREGRLVLPREGVEFLSEATAIRCRFSFATSDSASAKNYDFTFSRAQVDALRTLALKCLGE